MSALGSPAMPGRRWLPAALPWALAVLGCAPDVQPLDDGVVETAHLRITNTTGNPICAGTPILLERELERIAAAVELPLWPEDDKLEVRFGEDAVAEVCGDPAEGQLNGCVRRVDGELVVAAVEVSYTASHELVHALRRENGVWSTTAFEEGLAELLAGSDGFPRYLSYPHGEPIIGPVSLLEVPSEEFHRGHYVASASFLSWLWKTRGRSALMTFLNDPAFDGVEAARSFERPLIEVVLPAGEHDVMLTSLDPTGRFDSQTLRYERRCQ